MICGWLQTEHCPSVLLLQTSPPVFSVAFHGGEDTEIITVACLRLDGDCVTELGSEIISFHDDFLMVDENSVMVKAPDNWACLYAM